MGLSTRAQMAAVVCLAVLAGLLLAAPAEAAQLRFRDLNVKLVLETRDLATDTGEQFVSLRCPRGGTVIAGGAYIHRPGFGPEASLSLQTGVGHNPHPDMKGWTGVARNFGALSGLQLTVSAQCSRSFRYASRFDIPRGAPPHGSASYEFCPLGQLAVAGGAYSQKGYAITASSASLDRKMWYAEEYNPTLSGDVLHIVFGCSAKLKPTRIVTATVEVAVGQTGGTYLLCPDGTRVVSGGAFFHEPGQAPHPTNADDARIASSSPTNDHKGWYADGRRNTGANLVLSVVAHCLPY